MFRRAMARPAHHTETVGIIKNDQRVIFFRKRDDLVKRGNIPLH